MDFVKILESKLKIVDYNYLSLYIALVTKGDDIDEYTEKHHILPQRIFPQYRSLIKNPWNVIRLSYHNHILAHYYFSKATNTLWNAIHRLVHDNRKNIELKELSRIISDYKLNHVGKNHCRYGKKHSDESKAKMSNAKKGIPMQFETKSKISIANTGKIRSRETINKMIAYRLTFRHSDESKAKMSNTRRGRKLSQEWKDKISKSCKDVNLGRIHSEETRLNMSKSKIGSNNPMYGKQHTENTKCKMSKSNKKAMSNPLIWIDLYDELYELWLKSEKIQTGYKFTKWLNVNTDHRFTNTALKSLVRHFIEKDGD